MIRQLAEALAAAPHRMPRPTIGMPVAVPAPKLPPLPIEERRARLEAAMAWLKARCILVSVSDRQALVRKYRVTGRAPSLLAEEVIQHAENMGMNVDD